MMYRLLDALKTYWVALVIGGIAVGMMVYISNINADIRELESDIATVQQLIDDEKAKLANMKDFDKEGHKKVVQERTVSAQKIGEEYIAVDNALTEFYKSNEPIPTDEAQKKALFDKLEKAKAENTRLTGASEADHIKTWQLNPAWTLKLESVVTYRDTDQIPVVFSMTTAKGESAGLIYAFFDTKNYKLTQISKHYTPIGLRDEVDVGGL